MAIEGTVPGTRTEDAGAEAAVASGARSTAMWLMPIAVVVEVLITIETMRSIGFLPPLVGFVVVLAAIAILGFARPGPRVFLVGGILLLLFVAVNVPFIIDGMRAGVSSSAASGSGRVA